MDLAELMQPVLQHEAEQLAQIARENIFHSAGDSDRFAWLRRHGVADTIVASASGTSAVVRAFGKSAVTQELGAPGQPPAPFLRPALEARRGLFTQAASGAISQIIADQLARKRNGR